MSWNSVNESYNMLKYVKCYHYLTDENYICCHEKR